MQHQAFWIPLVQRSYTLSLVLNFFATMYDNQFNFGWVKYQGRILPVNVIKEQRNKIFKFKTSKISKLQCQEWEIGMK